MKNFLLHCFTGADNKTFDIGRVLWFAGCLVYLGLAIYAVTQGQKFDAMAYGGGLGAVLACGGAAIGMKGKTEPV